MSGEVEGVGEGGARRRGGEGSMGAEGGGCIDTRLDKSRRMQCRNGMELTIGDKMKEERWEE